MASKYVDPDGKSMQRFTDIAGEPRRMLTPIKGYEKMPLVSLEEAVVKPLDPFRARSRSNGLDCQAALYYTR